MLKSGQCTKCQSKNLIRIPGQAGPYGSGNNIPVGWMKIPLKVTRILCGDCGFSEEWVESAADRATLWKKFRGFER
jgi:hypothetical protein